jgi:hypothetical protein
MYKRLLDLLVEGSLESFGKFLNTGKERRLSGASRAFRRMRRSGKLPSGAHLKDVIPQSKERKEKRFERDMEKRAPKIGNNELDQWET